jgi:serine/threonine protein kinase
MIGQTFLNRFRVERLLCEGGMGQIYIARQLDRDREVAVKVLKEAVASQATAKERFRREMQVLGQFQHPYVVEFHGASTAPNDMFLVMEYVRGKDLDLLLALAGRFQPERVGRILVQLCEVLQALHDQGYVHCDLKPANMMVVHPGSPLESIKLMDFGVAKTPTPLSLTALEMAGDDIVSGTPQYMSPEQAAGEDVDHRADLYSVGVILFELLTGRLPFDGSTPADWIAAHKEQPPPALAERCPAAALVPRPIEAVVHRCLAKHREHRPQSATELAQLYEKALGSKIIRLPKRTAPPPPPPASAASAPLVSRTPAPSGGSSCGTQVQTPAPVAAPVVDPNAAVYELRVQMPQSMAMLKLRGFVQDLGGKLMEGNAAPSTGVVRVRLGDGEPPPSWSGASSPTPQRPESNGKLAAPGTMIDMELRIQRADAKDPNKLTITLSLRAKNNWSVSRREMKARYDKIHGALKAYLQATG